MVNINERLTELMLSKELDNKTLAAEIGVSGATIGRWKNNTKYMYLSQSLKLVDYFHCSLDFLTGRSDEILEFIPQECPPFYMHLRDVLADKGIKRSAVHRETRIKSSHFVDWKNGSDPHILSLIDLADYLDLTLDELVGREKIGKFSNK